MIRGRDISGNVILGITRRELRGIEKGLPCVFITKPELGGGPPVVLWFAETDADLLARMAEMFPEHAPRRAVDLRTYEQCGACGQAVPLNDLDRHGAKDCPARSEKETR